MMAVRHYQGIKVLIAGGQRHSRIADLIAEALDQSKEARREIASHMEKVGLIKIEIRITPEMGLEPWTEEQKKAGHRILDTLQRKLDQGSQD